MQTQNLREIVKIRDRGQMTLPEELRIAIPWLKPGSVVEIETNQPKTAVVIKPLVTRKYSYERKPYKQKMTMSWDTLKKNLEEIRKAGRQDVNLTEFLIRERDRRKYEI